MSERVILDACVPADFRHHITTADVVTARYVRLQNLSGRTIAIIVVRAKSNRMIDLMSTAAEVERVIATIAPGDVQEVVG